MCCPLLTHQSCKCLSCGVQPKSGWCVWKLVIWVCCWRCSLSEVLCVCTTPSCLDITPPKTTLLHPIVKYLKKIRETPPIKTSFHLLCLLCKLYIFSEHTLWANLYCLAAFGHPIPSTYWLHWPAASYHLATVVQSPCLGLTATAWSSFLELLLNFHLTIPSRRKNPTSFWIRTCNGENLASTAWFQKLCNAFLDNTAEDYVVFYLMGAMTTCIALFFTTLMLIGAWYTILTPQCACAQCGVGVVYPCVFMLFSSLCLLKIFSLSNYCEQAPLLVSKESEYISNHDCKLKPQT